MQPLGLFLLSQFGVLVTVGATLALQGTAQLFHRSPQFLLSKTELRQGKTQTLQGHKGVSRATSGRQSYAFSGPANTVGVGATVPLVYGKLLIGSHLLSSQVDVTNESDPTGEFFSIPGKSSVTINGEKPGNKFESLNGLRTRTWSHEQVRLAEESGSDAKRKKPNMMSKFDQASKLMVCLVQYDTDADNQQNFQILFKLTGGLFNVIGGQMVPAFVTYEITITKRRLHGR